jgi:hypothetical protein
MTLTEAEIAGLCEKLANWSYTYMCKARDSANDRELVEFTACTPRCIGPKANCV